MLAFKSEEVKQLLDREEIDNEDDLFEFINKLTTHGIYAGNLKKFQDAGIYTCNGLIMPTKKDVRVEHCELVHIIVAEKRICIANSPECIFFLGVNQRPLIVGDNHKLQVAPYNTYYSEIEEHMNQVGIDANINRWDEPVALGVVDPHDSLSHPASVSDAQAKSAACLDPNQFTNFLRRCSLEECMTMLLSDNDLSSVPLAYFLELEAATRSLTTHGINAGNLKKFQDAGIYTCNGSMVHTKKVENLDTESTAVLKREVSSVQQELEEIKKKLQIMVKHFQELQIRSKAEFKRELVPSHVQLFGYLKADDDTVRKLGQELRDRVRARELSERVTAIHVGSIYANGWVGHTDVFVVGMGPNPPSSFASARQPGSELVIILLKQEFAQYLPIKTVSKRNCTSYDELTRRIHRQWSLYRNLPQREVIPMIDQSFSGYQMTFYHIEEGVVDRISPRSDFSVFIPRLNAIVVKSPKLFHIYYRQQLQHIPKTLVILREPEERDMFIMSIVTHHIQSMADLMGRLKNCYRQYTGREDSTPLNVWPGARVFFLNINRGVLDSNNFMNLITNLNIILVSVEEYPYPPLQDVPDPAE